MQASTIRACIDTDVPSIVSIVNDGASRYRGVIPDDCWHEPYMSQHDLARELAAGVQFWGYIGNDGSLIGVMGVQRVLDATLIRHAYVRTSDQGRGVGSALLAMLIGRANGQLLVGTWAAAEWAIRLYERHGFQLVSTREKDTLLRTYWQISERQRETSVVLRYAGGPPTR